MCYSFVITMISTVFLEIAENCSHVEIKRDGQLKSNNRLSGLLMNQGKYPSMSIFTINNKDSALAILPLSPRVVYITPKSPNRTTPKKSHIKKPMHKLYIDLKRYLDSYFIFFLDCFTQYGKRSSNVRNPYFSVS